MMNRRTALRSLAALVAAGSARAAQQHAGVAAGMSTGGYHAGVFDREGRAITAGGDVAGAPAVFLDVTAGSGLDRFQHRCGGPRKRTILEAMGSGVALLDYDNDGWLDVYLVNGSTFPALAGREPAPQAMLLHNNRDGTFRDVTRQAGVGNGRWGMGVAVGDFDNDGWPDIYVANFGPNRLYRNNRDGTFTDVAPAAGLDLGGWSTAPSWGDYDRDGRLDLFVPGYVRFDPRHPPLAGRNGLPPAACQYRGVDVFCGPLGLAGAGDHLFHNDGGGVFSDVTAAAGVGGPPGGFGLAAAFVDADDDGWLDLVVANDSVGNCLYRNRRDGTFADDSYLSGLAVNGDGRAQACMGLGIGDYDRDGRLDFYLTTFSDDYNPLYRAGKDHYWTDVTYGLGLARPTIPFLGWGTGFLDFDNDGWLDIFVANGHVYPMVDQQHWGISYAQRPLLFRNLEGQRFTEVPAAPGSGLAVVIPARGAAFGDLFNSGRIDVVINNIDSTPTLLRNVAAAGRHWISFALVGGKGSPRDATGAQVRLCAGGAVQRQDVIRGGSYGSASDPRVHFGLGAALAVEWVEVRWPSGRRQRYAPAAVDRLHILREGGQG